MADDDTSRITRFGVTPTSPVRPANNDRLPRRFDRDGSTYTGEKAATLLSRRRDGDSYTSAPNNFSLNGIDRENAQWLLNQPDFKDVVSEEVKVGAQGKPGLAHLKHALEQAANATPNYLAQVTLQNAGAIIFAATQSTDGLWATAQPFAVKSTPSPKR